MGDTDGEWRFGVDEVGEDAADGEDALEPGEVDPENALFFLVGVAFAVGLVALAVV